MLDIMQMASRVLMLMIPMLLALTIHEFAHAWTANKLGDPTAKYMGRLSLSPLAHADPVGTLFLPILMVVMNVPFFIGWAKPVPVNSSNLKKPTRDMFLIASAGPASNFIQAFAASFLFVYVHFHVQTDDVGFYKELLRNYLGLNLGLTFFNLIPIFPLDGSRILAFFLPYKANRWIEERQDLGNILLLVLFVSGIISQILAYPINFSLNMMVAVAQTVIGA